MNTNQSSSRALGLKLLMVVLTAMAAVVFTFDSSKAPTENMTLLYGDLDAESAEQIAVKLKAEGLKVELRDEGRKVFVNSNLVYVLRARLTVEGIVPWRSENLDKREIAM